MVLTTTNLVRSHRGVYADDTARLTDQDLLASALNDVLWSGIKTQSVNNQQQVNLATVVVAHVSGGFILAFNDHNLNNRTQAQLPDLAALAQNNLPEIAVVAHHPGADGPAPALAADGDVVGDPGRRAVSIVTQIQARQGTTLVQRQFVPKFQNGGLIFSPKSALRTALEQMLLDDMITGTQGVTARKITILLPTQNSTEHAEMRVLGYCAANRISLSSLGVSKPCCHACAGALDEAGVHFSRWSVVKAMRGWAAPGEILNTEAQEI